MHCPCQPRALIAVLAAGLFLQFCSGADTGGSPSEANAAFRFGRLLIADTAAKAAALRAPAGPQRIVVADEPLLATAEFANSVAPYFGTPITPASVERLVNEVTGFLKSHGQHLVSVEVPPQNISGGEFRLVVVVGHYNLRRLMVAGGESQAASMKAAADATQIVVQDMPALATRDFAAAMAPYFGRPITDDSVSRMSADICAYVRGTGALVAAVAIPTQSIEGGEFRIGVVIGRYPLKRILIANAPETARKIPSPADGRRIVDDGAPALASGSFEALVAPYFGQPITPDMIETLKGQIVEYLKAHDRPVAYVAVPAEDLDRGELRIAVTIGRYSDLVIKGNRWFSNGLLMAELGIKPGDEIRTSKLEDAINWMNGMNGQGNTNPFRQIEVLINTLNVQPGTAALDVAVQGACPSGLSPRTTIMATT